MRSRTVEVLKQLVREPLVQFALLGIGLFGLYELRSETEVTNDQVIEVPASYAQMVERNLAAMTGERPSEARVRAEIDRYVREEILYREALRLGFDRHDPIVRRRMIQKMRLVLDKDTPEGPPSDLEMSRLAAVHPELVAVAEELSFEHHFFRNADGNGLQRAVQARRALLAGNEVASDAFSRGSKFTSMTRDTVRRIFGAEFDDALTEQEDGVWSQPLTSVHGIHLVRIRERNSGKEAGETARTRAALRLQRRSDHLDRELAAMRSRYRVEIGTRAR